MKKLFDSSQRFLRLGDGPTHSSIFHCILVAYPALRKLILFFALLAYTLLAYFANRELLSEIRPPYLIIIRTGITMAVVVIMTLIADHWMRHFFAQNRWKKLIPRLLLLILLGSVFRMLGDSVLIKLFLPEEVRFFGGRIYFVNILLTTFLIPIYLLPLHLADGWLRRNRLRSELEQKELQLKALALEAELKFLKVQVHPHFLFNILNNIYSLIEIDPSQAQDVVLKLSAMMQYMLYDCQEPRVPLDKEIQYLQHYIALHQLKKDGEMNITFEVKGAAPGMKIPPLLLVPLFENVFKHGNLENLSQGWMKAELCADSEGLRLQIQNTISGSRSNDLPGGIGLENVIGRLKALYPNQYEFIQSQTTDQFRVALFIPWQTRQINS
jgi:sensor histidine kinase YesM